MVDTDTRRPARRRRIPPTPAPLPRPGSGNHDPYGVPSRHRPGRKVLDVPTRRDRGHTTAEVNVGTVHVKFVHIDATSMAQHAARTSYGPNLASS